MAIVADGQIRMAYLAIVGSHSVNGVAALHTEILKNQELSDFYDIYPEKFNNKTNGITQRRWLGHANPELAAFITDKIGDKWYTDLSDLKKLEKYAQETANDSLIAGTLKYGKLNRNGEFYGQNLYLGSGNPRTGQYLAEYWYSENENYNYSTGKSLNGAPIGHFTQIVWKITQKIGCAVAIGRWKIYRESYYICCYYYPGGNLAGLYTKNVVRPIS